MTVVDQSGGSSPDSVDGDNNPMFSESSVSGLRLKEIYSSVDEHAPKVRKPYTITKQRERWTDEEHKKFLEALKLHGRAWRKIEEHIGTKTAVQIRSHAQKFFSKVVRESSDINGSSIKPTEIPPPRPKRKPMHPYPRKLVRSFKKGISVLDQSEMSTSPKFSVRDNQSPTSVLSAIGSDTSRSTASNPKSRSPSPVSSGVGGNSERENGCMIFSSSAYEENGVSTSIPISSTSIPEEKSPEKLDLGSQANYTKEGVDVEESTTCLKLFGKTVMVTNSHRPSSPPETHKPAPSESWKEDLYMNNENTAQRPTWNSLQVEVLMSATNGVWNPSPGQSPAFYYMPLTKEDLNPVNVAAPVPLPWWPSYGSLPFPLHRSSNQASEEMPAQSWPEETMENEINKERSLTGSNAASVCKVGNFNRNCNDVGSENLKTPPNGDLELVFQLKQSDTSAFSVRTTNSSKFVKGFVPYKRCLVQRETHSSSAPIGEEREGRRIRLCL